MRDFEAGGEFLFIVVQSSDMIQMLTMPPDPKTVKRKALLLIKARNETEADDDESGEFFPTGIANEVVFMEITGKTLGNLYSSCQVSLSFYLCNTCAELKRFESWKSWLTMFKFEFHNSSALNFIFWRLDL